MVQMTTHHDRFWEIDLIRGCAVIMMILFHAVFDLNFFSIVAIQTQSGFWKLVALTTAFLFIFLAGLSLTISHERKSDEPKRDRVRHSLLRGAGIFAIGILITVVTYLVLGEGFIIFGILHCIGLSIVLAIPFLGHPWRALGCAMLVLFGGLVVDLVNGPLWLAWAGVHPEPFYSVDYVPLVPWFGVLLLGVTLGSSLYPKGSRRFTIPAPTSPIFTRITFLGRHSLAIYLLHQPLILLLLRLLFPGSIPWIP